MNAQRCVGSFDLAVELGIGSCRIAASTFTTYDVHSGDLVPCSRVERQTPTGTNDVIVGMRGHGKDSHTNTLASKPSDLVGDNPAVYVDFVRAAPDPKITSAAQPWRGGMSTLIILGLNGWPGRGHDPAACLVVDGVVVALAEEERFTRTKHAYGASPVHAAAFCLAQGEVDLDDVDIVTFGWDIPRLYRDRSIPWELDDAAALELLLPRTVLPRQRDPQLRFVHHHLSHASSAFYLSGDSTAAVLVMDGQGDDSSATIFAAGSFGLRALETVPISWSLGYFYDSVGRFIGLGPDQAGKLMGLAAYGKPIDDTMGAFVWQKDTYEIPCLDPGLRSRDQIDEDDDVSSRWLDMLEQWASRPRNQRTTTFDAVTGRLRARPAHDPFEYRDLAATAQHILEKAATQLAERAIALTGSTTLHLAGGVALNASMNGVLLDSPSATRVFIQPLAGDAGVALGSALVAASEAGDRVEPMTSSIAWGWDIEPDHARDVITSTGLTYSEPADLAASVADLVAADKVVGWCQGRGEVGPRALGQRSIVAAPATRTMRDRINLQIKQREWWRPLAPSVTDETFHEIIDSPQLLPYMIVTRPLQDAVRAAMAAVDHVDGTTRPQSVSATSSPLYHQLLEHVEDRTGHAVVLNTSFNSQEEPIVWTAEDAIRTFVSIGLDALAVGPYLIKKP